MEAQSAMPALQQLAKTDMKFRPLQYHANGADQEIIILPEVLKHLDQNRQTKPFAPEVGGQLFAKIEMNRISVCLATGPSRTDRRGRYWFVPDQVRQNAEIQRLFKRKLHFVGDWHTHPQPVPLPSRTDLDSMRDCFKKSDHQLISFVMLIVGWDKFPNGLWASLHTDKRFEKLEPATDTVNPCHRHGTSANPVG